MNRKPFHYIDHTDDQQRREDWAASSQRFRELFSGHGSQFRKVLDDLGQLDPRARSAFQRLGEIQVASGVAVPWLVLHHASKGAWYAAQEVSKYTKCTPATLNSLWLDDRQETIERLQDFLNARLKPAVWGFSELGFPEFADRWDDWQDSYCAGIRKAHALTRKLTGKQRRIERLELCLDNLMDHLDELRELFRDMREVTGPGGWWGSPEVVWLLDELE